jgi:subtilisin family serine protease
MKYQILFLLTFLLSFLFVQNNTAQNNSQRIDTYLQGVMSAAAENELIDIYIVMKDRLNFTDLQAVTYNLPRKERRAEVVRILKEYATENMRDVKAYLNNLVINNRAENIQENWAINVLSLKAVKSVIIEISENFENIQSIHYDRQYNAEELVDDLGVTKFNTENNLFVEPTGNPQPGLTLIRAPLVWADGDSGKSVLVANIDTGTDWTHPDLINNIWQNLGEDANNNGQTIIWNGSAWVFDPGDINGIDDDGNGLIDDFVGWNWQNNNNNVISSSSHGTATSGIVAGYGTNGTQTGVAPGANLIILKPSGESQYWLAQQYALDKGADIVTSSLSYKWYFSPKPNYPMFRQMNDMELAAGIVHTNSTSNDGGSLGSAPIPYNISAPGNSPGPWVHPDQILVGGISSVIGSANVHAGTDVIVSSSPYGPSAWEDIQSIHPTYPYPMPLAYQDYPYETSPGSMGLIKPDIAAPGNGTTSTAPGGGYQTFSGTSGATPHLAGVAALLLGFNPNLEPADVSRIMQLTALERGAPGKDNRYGAGRVDAYDAYLLAVSEIPVELTSFSFDVFKDDVNLKWSTASETNNDGFEVQRAVLHPEFGKSPFIPLTFIRGYGTTAEFQSYSYTDKQLNPGIYFYRLKQQDFDGSYEYSQELTVEVTHPVGFGLMQNYPNPFNPFTTIEYSLPEQAEVKILIYSILGEEVASLVNMTKEAGYHRYYLNADNLPSGTYIYQLKAAGVNSTYIETKKMIVLK